MVGERTGVRYRLSDRVRVKLMRADLETNKIDFQLVGGGSADVPYGKPGTNKARRK
jgi:ribonuclease R